MKDPENEPDKEKLRLSADQLLIADKVKEHFFLRNSEMHFYISNLEPIIHEIPQEYRSIGEALKSNIVSLVEVAGLPSTLAFQGVSNLLWFRESVLELLGKPRSSPGDPELTLRAGEDLLAQLDRMAKDELIVEVAYQLMRQTLVHTWSVFEVLASDLFVDLLNNNPTYINLLWNDERTKKRFNLRDPAYLFQEYGFDFSKCMGSILIEQHRVDNVETIRSAFDVLFPYNQELRELPQGSPKTGHIGSAENRP